MKFAVSLLFLSAIGMQAQSLSVGVKGGGFFTEQADRQDQSRPYVVGPSIELGFGRIAVEGNALYSRFGSSVQGTRVRGHSVEFPVLGKFYFSDRNAAVRPFAGAGFAFRNIWLDRNRSNRIGGNRLDSTDPAVGAVFGAGVAFRIWKLRLAPEVRYTRWGGYNFPATNPDQVQGLLGVTF